MTQWPKNIYTAESTPPNPSPEHSFLLFRLVIFLTTSVSISTDVHGKAWYRNSRYWIMVVRQIVFWWRNQTAIPTSTNQKENNPYTCVRKVQQKKEAEDGDKKVKTSRAVCRILSKRRGEFAEKSLWFVSYFLPNHSRIFWSTSSGAAELLWNPTISMGRWSFSLQMCSNEIFLCRRVDCAPFWMVWSCPLEGTCRFTRCKFVSCVFALSI